MLSTRIRSGIQTQAGQVISWSECQVKELQTDIIWSADSQILATKSLYRYWMGQSLRELAPDIIWPYFVFYIYKDTRGNVYSHRPKQSLFKEATFFMAKQVMRITLKAYDHELVDQSAAKIIEAVRKNGSDVSGPVPLPTKKEVVTILRAVHKYKDSREQFEQRTHKRLIDVIAPTQKTVDVLQRLEMPAGVHIDIKMKEKN